MGAADGAGSSSVGAGDGAGAALPPESVCVAVNVRPLIDPEIMEGCVSKLVVTPGEPQVVVPGSPPHMFTFDHVFGEGSLPASTLFDKCVAPLVEGLFKGYNATVFAYGQSGSGKTYTMGSAFTPGGEARGVIPRVMEAIFDRIQSAPADVDFAVRVGFVEIHKEEIYDLLCKSTRGPQPAVHIREVSGGVCLAGATEREVRSRQEMVEVLEQGTLARATAATGMNKHSSRSHAIFTITLEQRKLLPPRTGDSQAAAARRGSDEDGEGDSGEDEEAEGSGEQDSYLCAKMHLVDLAGSERAKRTKAEGTRLQEGIDINRGLLALGNVINALSEGKQHIPYRDSKLTRMLQDSLGGNSRTVMIACVSPADVNVDESINTLRYANRARNIRNKPVVNRDPVAAQFAHMRQQLAALRAENQALKGQLGLGDGALLDFGSQGMEVLRSALEELEAQNRRLTAANKKLQVELGSAHDDLKDATEKMIVAQAQRDRLLQRLHEADPAAAAEAKAAADAIAGGSGAEGGSGGADVIQSQLERIAELEAEVKRLKKVNRLSGAFVVSNRRLSLAAPGEASPFHPSPLRSDDGEIGMDAISELELNDEEFAAQEQAHTMQTASLQEKLAQLQRLLDAKEAAKQSFERHPTLREAYDYRLRSLQRERDELQQEQRELLVKLQEVQHSSEEAQLKLKAGYQARIRELEERVKAVRAKERRVLELEGMKQKAEGACRRLERDILSIKQQKVALQRQMEQSVKEFTTFRRQRDAELLQLKKQGRLNAAQLQKLEALHSKQQAVLRRKTEEAEAARKRLKQMEERQKVASRPATSAAAARSAPSAAAGRPFTAPPLPPGPVRALHTGGSAGVERSAASAVDPESECNPNPDAPLLRDERSRREWVESELDAYCSSYQLQKIMDAERAQRKEVQRKLREVEKALAALKNPEWWPAHMVQSPSSGSEEKLLQRKRALQEQSEQHSREFERAQAKLMQARQAEEERGGLPGDAKRWTSVRTAVQARALLKTLFRAASQHKAQAMEAQAQVTELTDEIELLKLRLDIAEQEKYDAAQRAAEAHALLTAAQQAAERVGGGGGGRSSSGSGAEATHTTPAKQIVASARAAAEDVPADEGLLEAQQILQQLDHLAGAGRLTGQGSTEEAEHRSIASDSEEEDEEGSWDELEEEEEEEEEDQSEDESRHALWDPSTATPARAGPKGRRQVAAGEAPQRRRRSSAASGGGRGPVGEEEQPVLHHLNEQLRRQGKEPVSKPTVALMKEVLKDRVINGQRWRLGSKKREELVRDYRAMLGLKPEVETPAAAASSAPQQQQQQQQPLSARGSCEGGSGGSLSARSRILEHTASSLARCHATLQHPGLQAHQAASFAGAAAAAAVAAAGPAAPRAFGSPLPPQHSGVGSTAEEQAEGGSTPVGAEGLTPEAAVPEERPCCDTELLLRASPRIVSAAPPSALPEGPAAAPAAEDGRRRDLQLGDLQRQLAELQLGLNPAAATAAAALPAAAAAVGPQGRGVADAEGSPSPLLTARSARGRGGSAGVASDGSPRRGGSPFRRIMDLAGWVRRGGRSRSRSPSVDPCQLAPPAPAAGAAGMAAATAVVAAPPGLRVETGRGAGSQLGGSQPSSPALAAYEQRAHHFRQQAAHAMQLIDEELLQAPPASRPGSGPAPTSSGGGRPTTPPTAAFGKEGSGGKPLPKQAGSAGEALYELQAAPDKLAAAAVAAQPLRSSNGTGHSTSCGEVGSRSGSPRDDFRMGAAPENRGSRPRSAAQSPRASHHQRPGSGRPRSGGSGSVPTSARLQPHASPRKAAWKPL